MMNSCRNGSFDSNDCGEEGCRGGPSPNGRGWHRGWTTGSMVYRRVDSCYLRYTPLTRPYPVGREDFFIARPYC